MTMITGRELTGRVLVAFLDENDEPITSVVFRDGRPSFEQGMRYSGGPELSITVTGSLYDAVRHAPK